MDNMSIYDELGLKPMINAAGTYTVVGGSVMSNETLDCMAQAARQHVDIRELQREVQNRIAQMTRNEAAVVCNGAASGLYLCAAAAVSRKLEKKARYLNRDELGSCEILAMNGHHIPYDFAVRQLGVKQKWVGFPNIEGSMTVEDLEAGITDNTAAIFYFISSPYGLKTPGVLSLEETAKVAEKYDLPLIVDGAAQLPPVENLWDFTAMGATAAIFSGGKYVRGPQSSGFIVGKRDFLSIVQETNFPNYGFGRMLKTGREEIAGLYSALKQFVESDHKADRERAEKMVAALIEAFSESKLYSMKREFPNEAGQPMAFVRVTLKENKTIDVKTVAQKMKEGTPSVYLMPEGETLFINPMTLFDRELSLVIERLKSVESALQGDKICQ